MTKISSFHLTLIPGSAPMSGEIIKMSSPPGPAAKIIPSDKPKLISLGARLFTSTTNLSLSSSIL